MSYLRELHDASTGMAYRMFVGSNGKFRINAQDVDSGEYVPVMRDYPTRERADAAFDELAAAVKAGA